MFIYWVWFLCSFVIFLGEGRLPGYHWKFAFTGFLGNMEQIRSVSRLICCYFLRGEIVLILGEQRKTWFAASSHSPLLTFFSLLSTQGVVPQHFRMIQVRAVGFRPCLCCVFLLLPTCLQTATPCYGELVQWEAGQKIMDDDFIYWRHCQKLFLFFSPL